MGKIKVLVCDDSLFMRQAITKVITCDEIEVVDTAKNGKEAIEKVISVQPDLVTMDIEMPVMNGIEAVKEIMKVHPVPILMLSTLTNEGAIATIEALSNGAVDFITKKAAFKEMDSIKEELIEKIKLIAANSDLKNKLIRQSLLRKMERVKSENINANSQKGQRPGINDLKIIGIGISTGGPNTLIDFLKVFPDDFPVPILIVQHMPSYFTKSLAERLDNLCHLKVVEAKDNDKLVPGVVYLAPGGHQMTVNRHNYIVISPEDKEQLFNPSANVLFNSLASVYGKSTLGIIMTGMGNDGTLGLKNVHRNGGYILAQDPDTCVVAGMSKSVIDNNLANEIIPINQMATVVCSLFGKKTTIPKLIKKEFIR